MSKFFSGSSKSVSSSSTQYPSWITPELQKIVEKSTELTEAPFQPYGDERVAGLSPDELQAFDMVRQLVGGTQPYYQQAQDITAQIAQRGLGGFQPSEIQAWMNPYQQQVMDVSKLRQEQEFEKAKRDLASQQAQIGAFGGSRSAIAEQELYKNYAQQLAEQEARQLYQGYGDAMSRAISGTQTAGQAAGQMASLATAGQGATLQQAAALQQDGIAARGIDQARLDAAYQEYLMGLQDPYQKLQFQASMIEPIAGMTGTTTNVSKQSSSPSPAAIVGGIASMAMGVPGIAGGLGSLAGSAGLGSLLGLQSGSQVTGFFGSNPFSQGMIRGMGFQGPGWAKGGKVEIDESNDLPSKIDPDFARLLMAASLGIQTGDPYWDQETYPGGPTRGELMATMHNWEESGGLSRGYIDGGIVKKHKQHVYGMPPMGTPSAQAGYACGGEVKHYEDGGFIDRLGNLSWGGLYEDLKNRNRMAGEQIKDLGIGAYEFAKEHPNLIGVAALLAPEIAAGGRMAVAGAKGLSQFGPKAAQLAKESPKLAKALRYVGAGILGLSDGKSTEPTEAQKKADAIVENLGLKLPVDTKKKIDMSLASAKPKKEKAIPEVHKLMTEKPKDELNLPLIAFGASLLGSSGNFFQALGQAGKEFTTVKMSQEEAIRKAAKEALDRKLDERRVAAYERQTALGEAKLPYSNELNRLKIETAQRKLQGGDPTMLKLVTELTKANPMAAPEDVLLQAQTLSQGIQGGTPAPMSTPDLTGWSIR